MDGGNTWSNHNVGLAITTFYYGALHPTNPNFALAGSQDNGTEMWQGSNSWQWVYSGDGADTGISPTRPGTNWAVSSQQLDINRTVDGGVTYTDATAGLVKTNAPFIASFRISPSNEDIVITGTTNLWKCTNFFSGTTPTWFFNGPTTSARIRGTALSAMAFAPSDGAANTYVFANSAGELRLTTDGGSTWSDIRDPAVLPGRYVTALAFHPTNASILYVTYSGFNEGTPAHPGHVFTTVNALAATPVWSRITTPVNLPHNSFAIDPTDPNTVYAGTDLGIWRSRNAGNLWTRMGPETGLPNVAVYDIKINANGRVVAFTNGRSAFALVTEAQRRLNIAPNGPNVIVSWPALAVNLVLQSASQLSGTGAWITADGTPTLVGNQYYVTNSAAGAGFYRLKSQ